jgi:hypothetical protein
MALVKDTLIDAMVTDWNPFTPFGALHILDAFAGEDFDIVAGKSYSPRAEPQVEFGGKLPVRE